MNYIQSDWLQKQQKYSFLSNFDWGDLSEDIRSYIQWEICDRYIYDRWNSVKHGDIVVDIGSSVGPFSYIAAVNGAKKLYLLEPSNSLLKTSIKNLSDFIINSDNRFTFINYAISDKDQTNQDKKNSNSIIFGDNETFNSMKFSTFINTYNIDHIDFLKIDCEGGEYDIFIEENINFLKNNVKFMSIEVHSRDIKNAHSKFIEFRDKYLSRFNNINVITGDEIIWNDHLYDDKIILNVLDNTELIIYIQN